MVAAPLPWPLKRLFLGKLLGFQLDPTSRIGLSLVAPARLRLGPGARIGHGNVVKGLGSVELEAGASLGNFNWITGFPEGPSPHFAHVSGRRPALHLGREAAITHRHLIDCTDRVEIGPFTTFAGFRSQILTHSLDLAEGRQDCAPVTVGERSFVGTGCILLPGSALPARSVLAAGAVLNRSWEQPGVYGGVPAKRIQDASGRYFDRERGFCV